MEYLQEYGYNPPLSRSAAREEFPHRPAHVVLILTNLLLPFIPPGPPDLALSMSTILRCYGAGPWPTAAPHHLIYLCRRDNTPITSRSNPRSLLSFSRLQSASTSTVRLRLRLSLARCIFFPSKTLDVYPLIETLFEWARSFSQVNPARIHHVSSVTARSRGCSDPPRSNRIAGTRADNP